MISSVQLSSSSAVVAYHADAFTLANEKSLDGLMDERVAAEWGGKGADLAGFGVGAQVRQDDFQNALDGRLAAEQIMGGWSKKEQALVHKPGMDFTFSPGKTVSIEALVRGDDRIIAAHDSAVAAALIYLEQQGSRVRLDGKDLVSDNLLYAKFSHETSRQQDPQLHTHVVITNAVFVPDRAAGNNNSRNTNHPSITLKEHDHDSVAKSHDPRREIDRSALLQSSADRARRGEQQAVASMRDLSSISLVQDRQRADVLLRNVPLSVMDEKSQAHHDLRRQASGTDRAGQSGAGHWRALNNYELLSLRKSADKVYGEALERNLNRLGYATEPGKSGPEITGYSAAQVTEFSRRTGDIKRGLEAKGLTIETATPSQKQVANLATRPDKVAVPRAELVADWQDRAVKVGMSIEPQVREPAPVRAPKLTQEQVTAAVDRVIETMITARNDVRDLTSDLKHVTSMRASVIDEQLKPLRLQLTKTEGQLGHDVREQPGMQFASKAMIAKAVEGAKADGRLHDNVGKLSVETVKQTDARMAGDKTRRTDAYAAQSASRTASRELLTSARKVSTAARAAEKNAAYAAKRALQAPKSLIIAGIFRPVYVLKNPWAVAIHNDRKLAKYKPLGMAASLTVKTGWLSVASVKLASKAGFALGKVLVKGIHLAVSSTARAGLGKEIAAAHQQTAGIKARLQQGWYKNEASGMMRPKFTATNLIAVALAGSSNKLVSTMAAKHVKMTRVGHTEKLLGYTVLGIAGTTKALGRLAKSAGRALNKGIEHVGSKVETQRHAKVWTEYLGAKKEHAAGRMSDAAFSQVREKVEMTAAKRFTLIERTEQAKAAQKDIYSARSELTVASKAAYAEKTVAARANAWEATERLSAKENVLATLHRNPELTTEQAERVTAKVEQLLEGKDADKFLGLSRREAAKIEESVKAERVVPVENAAKERASKLDRKAEQSTGRTREELDNVRSAAPAKGKERSVGYD